MKALVIFNPSAGTSTKEDTEKLVRDKLASLGFDIDLFYLNPEFERNIAGYDFNGVNLVMAVGGDGTAKVAARTAIENKIQAPLSIIPFGSANIMAATLNLPSGTKNNLALLDGLKTAKIDVGLINKKHYFLVGFSIGYVSSIVISTSHHLKNRFGFLGYLIRFIFNKIKIKRIKFKITTQNRTFWVKGNSLIVFNAFNLYGIRPKKSIDISDGILNLYTITNKTFFTLFEAAYYALRYHRPPKHVFTLDNSHFEISVNKKKYLDTCQVDGDYIDLPQRMEIEVLPMALEVVVK